MRSEMKHRCCSKQKVKRGLWSPEEDEKLLNFLSTHSLNCSWSSVPKLAGLQRCGKSCRLRWINYLRPDLKKGSFTEEEERTIIEVHRILGNKWAQIAKHLPGRTDNEVKNFWNSSLKKKLLSLGLDPTTHNLLISNKPHTNNINNKYYSFTIDHHHAQNKPHTKLSLPVSHNAGPVYPFGYSGFVVNDDGFRPADENSMWVQSFEDPQLQLRFDHGASFCTTHHDSCLDFGFGDCSTILQSGGVFGDQIASANGDDQLESILIS